MRLTTKGQYAVTAIVDLAKHSDGKPVALADVADRQGISLSYLEQVSQKLRRAELVKRDWCPGGVYSLSKDSREMISNVIAAVDEPMRNEMCAGTPRAVWAGSKNVSPTTFGTNSVIRSLVPQFRNLVRCCGRPHSP